MLRHTLSALAIVLGTWTFSLTLGGTSAWGAENNNPNLLDRIDRFGRNVFGGLFPTSDEPTAESRPRPKPKPQRRALLDLNETDAGDNAAETRETPSESTRRERAPHRSPSARQADDSPAAERASDDGDALPSRPLPQRPVPPAAASQRGYEPKPEPRAAVRSTAVRPAPADAAVRVVAAEATSAAKSTPAMKAAPASESLPTPAAQASSSDKPASPDVRSLPLYQRMSLMRRSPFEAASAPPAAASSPPPSAAPAPAAAATSSSAAQASPKSTLETSPTIVRPTPAATIATTTRVSEQAFNITGPAPTQNESAAVRNPTRPITVMPPPAAVGAALAESSTRSTAVPPAASVSVSAAPPAATAPTTVEPVARSRVESIAANTTAARSAPPAASGGNVLLARQSPNLRVETIGPRRISVGKEASYEVTVHNSGEVAAEELLVTVDLPTWAEVRSSEAGQGRAEMVAVAAGRQLLWKVGRLDAQGRQRLLIRLVPRESKPFDLAVRWDFRQTATQASIEVQEPKLAVTVEGPREVLFGKKEVYRVKVANSGTGDAENVLLKLWPVGAGAAAAASQALGNLAPGEQRLIEAELTARQVGNLTMKVEALCDGNIRAEAAEPVAVLRAGLEVQADGAQHQFVGTTGAYRVRVANPGTAPARGVMLQATLPADVKCVAATLDGQIEPNGLVRWKLGDLPPGANKIVELKCLLGRAGDLRLEIAAAADDDLRAVAAAVTQVEATADLVMEVVDPQGPVAVGADAAYELRIRNRGSLGAEGVEVAAFFSQGIEPVLVEGGPHRISVGQVTFSPIPSLPAGKEVRLRIVARAQTAGTHIFRAEVHCRPLGVRLANEETTRFYVLEGGAGMMAGKPDVVPQTADRRNDAATPPANAAQPDRPLQR